MANVANWRHAEIFGECGLIGAGYLLACMKEL